MYNNYNSFLVVFWILIFSIKYFLSWNQFLMMILILESISMLTLLMVGLYVKLSFLSAVTLFFVLIMIVGEAVLGMSLAIFASRTSVNYVSQLSFS